MNDLTIIFLTVNKVPEKWAEYHKQVLMEAIGDTPIITISKKPMDWGLNLIQEAEPSIANIYKQILRGAELVKTPFIAIAEDDCLYHQCHFEFRPDKDTYAFDGHRWGLHTWGKPIFYWKDRISNGAMIAPRELVVKSLTERFDKYPDNHIGELGKEKGTTLNRYKSINYWPEVGMVYFSHRNSLDGTEQRRTKRPGAVKAMEIPYWGRAENLIKKFI